MGGGKGTDFFRPFWLRAAIVAACAGWALLEYLNGQTGWALMAVAVTGYGLWSLIIAWEPNDAKRPKDGE